MGARVIDAATGLEALVKQPSESRLYDIDFANLLRSGDAIASVISYYGVVQDPGTGSVTIGTAVVNGTKAQARISGGEDEEDYKISAVVQTVGGDTLESDGILYVRAL